ncbi:EamA family transporter [Prevotella sp. PINT]|jgi:Permeases of the drug/metabolite transporter (DMT) superfamily|uniref:DMT family transporter n=1 Tax=Palleniella intestinalis TaxID=2736291 RepID=UPI0015533C7D|nr:DMT family transporter [Palleniella intestinalis]NPD80412.1 EamA family transporter [Palleniella intestinalis]
MGLGKIKGHAALIGANVIWGLYAPLCKDLLNAQIIPPLILAGIKTAGAAALFWVLWAVFRIVKPSHTISKEHIEKKDYLKILNASLMIIAANQIFITLGLKYASPVDGTVLCGITPFFTLVLGVVFLKQRVGWIKNLGAILGFAGMLLFVFGSDVNTAMHVSNPVLGDTLFVLSQVCGAIYLVFSGDILGKYSSFTLMKWMFLISAVIMLPLYVPDVMALDWTLLSTDMWIEFGYIITFATFLAFLLLPVGQKQVSPTTVAMYNYLQPVVTATYAVIFGLAQLSMQTIVATALIFVGVWIVNRDNK